MVDLPGHADVVVIGGGVMGCSVLYHLAEAGVRDAVLVERNRLGSGTTWHSAAQVRALRSTRNLTELVQYSQDLYARLEAETGQATGWIRKGAISIATTPERVTHVRRQEALARLFGLEAHWISAGEAHERWPLMNADDVLGAVWTPGDGRVSPTDLCAALARGARARGARIEEQTGVTGLILEAGRVRGVRTDRGEIRADRVAVCAGLWSREVAGMAGAAAPLWPCEHFYLLTKGLDEIEGNLPTLADQGGHLYIRDDSGGLLIGCFEPWGKAIDPARLGPDFAFQLLPEDWDHFEPMMGKALHRLPILEDAEIKMLLNGPESFTPDGLFLLGESGVPGLYLGTGMNSVGVATGGGAGRALAQLMAHGATPTDLSAADPRRFALVWNDAGALAARMPEELGNHYAIPFPGRQMRTARDLRALPLDGAWRAAGAQMAQVMGYERPLWFGAPGPLGWGQPAWHGAVAGEVATAHEGAALFDASSFGKIRVTGPDAERLLQRACANDMARAPGRAIYTAMLTARGTFHSDLTALRLGDEDYRLFVPTTAIRRDLDWLRALAEGLRVTLGDETDALAVLALMGPDALAIAGAECAALGYFRHGPAEVAGVAVHAARLSYVGEAGVELTLPAAEAPRLWQALASAGVRPAGSLAQTAMRIEKGFCAMGHELDGDITPIEAGLDFAVAWQTDFHGREALGRARDAGAARRVVSLSVAPDAWPHGGEPVYAGGRPIGQVTSAAFGHRVGHGVALAVLAPGPIPETAEIDIARTMIPARVTLGPLYDPDGTRMRP